MLKTAIAAIALAAAGLAAVPAASETPNGKADPKFLGIDLDSGRTYYDGRNDGKYCLYRTVRVFNADTGYVELRRLRRCGRGLYL